MTVNYEAYISDGNKTLSQVCQENDVQLIDVLSTNVQIVNYYQLENYELYSDYLGKSTRDLLNYLNTNNLKLPKGLMILIGKSTTGGISDKATEAYYGYQQYELLSQYTPSGWNVGSDSLNPVENNSGLNTVEYSIDKTYRNWDIYDGISSDLSAQTDWRVKASDQLGKPQAKEWGYKVKDLKYLADRKYRKDLNTIDSLQLKYFAPKSYTDLGCRCIIYAGGSGMRSLYLPVYPHDVTDDNSVNYSAQSLLGRSVDYQIYQSSQRSLSFSLEMYEDLVSNDYGYIRYVAGAIASACYPEYSANLVNPPEIEFILGNHFRIRGILTSCSASWSPPIIDGNLVHCVLSVGVTETTGPYSMSQVASMKGYRGF